MTMVGDIQKLENILKMFAKLYNVNCKVYLLVINIKMLKKRQ